MSVTCVFQFTFSLCILKKQISFKNKILEALNGFQRFLSFFFFFFFKANEYCSLEAISSLPSLLPSFSFILSLSFYFFLFLKKIIYGCAGSLLLLTGFL